MLVHKTRTSKTENYIEVDNKYDSDELDVIMAKKSRKDMVDARSDKKLNGSKAKVFQSTH